MMKITKIEIEAWNSHNGRYTYLRRYYTNPGMKHMVRLHPDKVVTYLFKGNHHPIKPGIQHRVRP